MVRHCLYAVDRNPLAVDLCKVALWLESQAPGVPLSFLDHRVRCGDALVGVFDLGVLQAGIPDEAFKALTGDDKEVAKGLAKRNKAERKASLFQAKAAEDLADFAAALAALDALDEPDPAGVAAKARRYAELRHDPAWERWKTACDLWCAAFYAPKTAAWAKRTPTTAQVWQALADPVRLPSELRAHAVSLAEDRAVLHWPLEFPEVMAAGGFDVLLGNPPWERIKLQEQEFFAARDPGIAKAPNKAARQKMIASLAAGFLGSAERQLHGAYEQAKRFADADSLFVRESGRFPLTAFGDVNTYALFAENFLRLTGPAGRSGIIVPTGIATDNTTKVFFDTLATGQMLESIVAFENEEFIFRAVHHAFRFALLTVRGRSADRPASFMFFGRRIEHATDPRRRFTLTPADIALLNPNSRTCPVFRTAPDAELTKKIYRRVPVLIDEAKGAAGNPWGISFLRMFDMANDSGLFRTRDELAAQGAELWATCSCCPTRTPTRARTGCPRRAWLPLYEAKMVHHFDHRWFSYCRRARGRCGGRGEAAARAPDAAALPRYWVEERLVDERLAAKGWTRGWLMGWRDITLVTNERTVIASVVPRVGVGNNFR